MFRKCFNMVNNMGHIVGLISTINLLWIIMLVHDIFLIHNIITEHLVGLILWVAFLFGIDISVCVEREIMLMILDSLNIIISLCTIFLRKF